MDGEVTTKFAKKTFEFLSAALRFSAKFTVLAGKVVLIVVVAMGMYMILLEFVSSSSKLTDMETAATRAWWAISWGEKYMR